MSPSHELESGSCFCEIAVIQQPESCPSHLQTHKVLGGEPRAIGSDRDSTAFSSYSFLFLPFPLPACFSSDPDSAPPSWWAAVTS